MIHWLLESRQNLTEPPEAFLSNAEMEKFAAFRFPKRRDDWLLGRWTAKRLIQALTVAKLGLIPGNAIEIWNDADGVPRVMLDGEPLALNLSISHSHDYALCAALLCESAQSKEMRLGADLETIEPRETYFAGDYFTAKEMERVGNASPALLDIVVTVIWSAKEAVLKALHKGLSVDTRDVEISIPSFKNAPLNWSRFDAAWGREPKVPSLHGWWCVRAGFVLTLAATTPDAPDAAPARLETSLNLSGEDHGKRHGMLSHRIAYATRHHTRHSQGH